ncbi:MAG: hypothetical protein V4672_21420 [Verrucomicrobiota bacterium]
MKTSFISFLFLLWAVAGFPRIAIAFPGGSDHFILATNIPPEGGSFSEITDILNYTRVSTEPQHSPDGSTTSGRSAWWRWTAPQTGYCNVDSLSLNGLFGSVTDTTLAVYTGSSSSNLTPVVSSGDIISPEGLMISRHAQAGFLAIQGTTYYIAVDGGSPGAVQAGQSNVRLVFLFMPLKRSIRTAVLHYGPSTAPIGLVTLTTTDKGTFTGKLTLNHQVLPFAGVFSLTGSARLTLPQKIKPSPGPITLDISSFNSWSVSATMPDGSRASGDPFAEKAVFTKTSPNPHTGRCNIFLKPGAARSPGYLSCSISASGSVTGAGCAPDGSSVTLSTALHSTGEGHRYQLPAYRSLLSGLAELALAAELPAQGSPSEFTGSADFRRHPGKPGALIYPQGRTESLFVEGSSYPKPQPRLRAQGYLDATEGVADFRVTNAGAELPGNVLESVTLSTANKFSFLLPTVSVKPTLTLNASTGLVTGSFTAPGAGQKKHAVKGVLFRDNNVWMIKGLATGIAQMLPFEMTP